MCVHCVPAQYLLRPDDVTDPLKQDSQMAVSHHLGQWKLYHGPVLEVQMLETTVPSLQPHTTFFNKNNKKVRYFSIRQVDTSELEVYIVSSKTTVKQTRRKYFTCLRSKNRVRGGDWVMNKSVWDTEKRLSFPRPGPEKPCAKTVLWCPAYQGFFLQKAEL